MNVVPLPLPWAELSILVALVGALCVSRVRDAIPAYRVGLVCTGLSFACTLVAFLGFYLCQSGGFSDDWSLQKHFLGRAYLDIDELNAPLLPMVGLLHFLTALATGRTKMRRFSSGWLPPPSDSRRSPASCRGPSSRCWPSARFRAGSNWSTAASRRASTSST
jgi:NADH-quinone oxidoreductase subunit M